MSLVFDLIDRGIQLLRRREESSRALYDHVVAPLLRDFEVVHRNYIESFRAYRDKLSKATDLDASFLEALSADSLYSEDLRTRLRAFADAQSDSRVLPLVEAISLYLSLATATPIDGWDEQLDLVKWPLSSQPLQNYDDLPLATFVLDHLDYLSIRPSSKEPPQRITNIGRLYVAKGVAKLLSDERKSATEKLQFAIRLLDVVVSALQVRYAVVLEVHSHLAGTLRRPL